MPGLDVLDFGPVENEQRTRRPRQERVTHGARVWFTPGVPASRIEGPCAAHAPTLGAKAEDCAEARPPRTTSELRRLRIVKHAGRCVEDTRDDAI